MLQSQGVDVRLCSIPRIVHGVVGLRLCTLFWGEPANLVARPEGAQTIRINNTIFHPSPWLTIADQDKEVQDLILQRTVEAAWGGYQVRGASTRWTRSRLTYSLISFNTNLWLLVVKQEH